MWARNYVLFTANLFSASEVDLKFYFSYICMGIHLLISLQIFFNLVIHILVHKTT